MFGRLGIEALRKYYIWKNNKTNDVLDLKIINWIDGKVIPYNTKVFWGKRSASNIKRIVVHQSLGDTTTTSVNKYHIGKNNHISSRGCPHICYHYAVEKDGLIIHCNKHTDVVWHCRGQNTNSIGIVVHGNFDGKSHIGGMSPSQNQKDSLIKLLSYICRMHNIDRKHVHGHNYFGKENCPGDEIFDLLNKFKNS
jgi:hypothetical protein